MAIAASMSAGLVANFGTMTKPYQLGRAAQSGVLAAQMAARGITAGRDAQEHPQGFLAAFSPAGHGDVATQPAFGRSRWSVNEVVSVTTFHVVYSGPRLQKIDRTSRRGRGGQKV